MSEDKSKTKSKGYWDDGIPRVPCKICGTLTIYAHDKLCDGCWNVERGIENYLRFKEGRKNMKKFMKNAKKFINKFCFHPKI